MPVIIVLFMFLVRRELALNIISIMPFPMLFFSQCVFRGVQIVDTTCPWVSKVWNAVDKQTKRSHTSIIHGKWAHEETVATASFAGMYWILSAIHYFCTHIKLFGASLFSTWQNLSLSLLFLEKMPAGYLLL